MRPIVRAWITLVSSALLAGCFGEEVTEFPPGLEPLEENQVELPEGTPADPFPDVVTIESVVGSSYDTIYARGYLHAPIADVWTAFRDPAAVTDRRSASEWSVEQRESDEYDDLFVVHCITYDIVTVEWWTEWRHGVVEGTESAPELVAVRWQKTEGSTILRLIEGSLILRAVSDSVTEVDLVYRNDAFGATHEQYVQYVADVLANVRALLAGEPLPTY